MNDFFPLQSNAGLGQNRVVEFVKSVRRGRGDGEGKVEKGKWRREGKVNNRRRREGKVEKGEEGRK